MEWSKIPTLVGPTVRSSKPQDKLDGSSQGVHCLPGDCISSLALSQQHATADWVAQSTETRYPTVLGARSQKAGVGRTVLPRRLFQRLVAAGFPGTPGWQL